MGFRGTLFSDKPRCLREALQQLVVAGWRIEDTFARHHSVRKPISAGWDGWKYQSGTLLDAMPRPLAHMNSYDSRKAIWIPLISDFTHLHLKTSTHGFHGGFYHHGEMKNSNWFHSVRYRQGRCHPGHHPEAGAQTYLHGERFAHLRAGGGLGNPPAQNRWWCIAGVLVVDFMENPKKKQKKTILRCLFGK